MFYCFVIYCFVIYWLLLLLLLFYFIMYVMYYLLYSFILRVDSFCPFVGPKLMLDDDDSGCFFAVFTIYLIFFCDTQLMR